MAWCWVEARQPTLSGKMRTGKSRQAARGLNTPPATPMTAPQHPHLSANQGSLIYASLRSQGFQMRMTPVALGAKPFKYALQFFWLSKDKLHAVNAPQAATCHTVVYLGFLFAAARFIPCSRSLPEHHSSPHLHDQNHQHPPTPRPCTTQT